MLRMTFCELLLFSFNMYWFYYDYSLNKIVVWSTTISNIFLEEYSSFRILWNNTPII